MTILYSARRFASRLASLSALAIMLCVCSPARASNPYNDVVPDPVTLAAQEQRAAQANPREQCFLYAEVLHNLTEMAGQQLARGDDDAAVSTFQHIDVVAAKLEQVSGRDAKRLKNAELLLEHISHRVSDMARVASGEERSLVQATLRRVESVHSGLLALVFSH